MWPNKYILSHASETDLDVVKSNINLYVNDFSVSLVNIGRKSVQKLFNEFIIFSDEIFFKWKKVFLLYEVYTFNIIIFI